MVNVGMMFTNFFYNYNSQNLANKNNKNFYNITTQTKIMSFTYDKHSKIFKGVILNQPILGVVERDLECLTDYEVEQIVFVGKDYISADLKQQKVGGNFRTFFTTKAFGDDFLFNCDVKWGDCVKVDNKIENQGTLSNNTLF